MLLLHQCRNEMAAGVGSAPTSADLQSAAHLSEPSSVLLKMVPRRGDAPRSAGYRPAALLLSYRGIEKGMSQKAGTTARKAAATNEASAPDYRPKYAGLQHSILYPPPPAGDRLSGLHQPWAAGHAHRRGLAFGAGFFRTAAE